jgi:hypothetical protein
MQLDNSGFNRKILDAKLKTTQEIKNESLANLNKGLRKQNVLMTVVTVLIFTGIAINVFTIHISNMNFVNLVVIRSSLTFLFLSFIGVIGLNIRASRKECLELRTTYNSQCDLLLQTEWRYINKDDPDFIKEALPGHSFNSPKNVDVSVGNNKNGNKKTATGKIIRLVQPDK